MRQPSRQKGTNACPIKWDLLVPESGKNYRQDAAVCWWKPIRSDFDPSKPTLKIPAPSSHTRYALLLTGLIAVWGISGCQGSLRHSVLTKPCHRQARSTIKSKSELKGVLGDLAHQLTVTIIFVADSAIGWESGRCAA
jgi:hypothetical protein